MKKALTVEVLSDGEAAKEDIASERESSPQRESEGAIVDADLPVEGHKSSSSEGAMFAYDAQEDPNDSLESPQSAKFSQDEEFTDPDDPIAVIKTALHIDKVIQDEEIDRRIKSRKMEEDEDSKVSVVELKTFSEAPVDQENEEERTLLNKYRMNMKELEATKKQEFDEDAEIEDIEDEVFDADLIVKSLYKKQQPESVKKEVQKEMVEINKNQIKEPDFIYDGENTLIKIGS